MSSQPSDHYTTYIQVPLAPIQEHGMEYYQCHALGFGGGYSELLLMDPTGYTAVIVDPAMNRIEFRGDFHPGDSGIDTHAWKFFRRL